jgi:transposase
MLYDVTSTYFEGEALSNPQAQRGHSRDQRPDCKQVCIALVVTREGMPLGYEVFAGNRTDVTTVEEVVETMEARYGIAERVWVMDRGMMSAENVEWLQETGHRYLLGAAKSELKRWGREIAEERDWQQVHEGVEAKLCPGPQGSEIFLLCRSADRREKEKAMHERFAKRIEARLERLARRLERSRRPLEREPIERQIGRILGQNSRAAGRYQIRVVDDAERASKLRLVWSVHPEWDEWACYSEGTYILRTNVPDWTPEELWRTYVQLTEAEAAFRIHKSDLSIRPIWHQKAERVQAHILVCFLAYVLWKTLEQWQRRAGLGSSPRTILEEIGRIQSTDVVLPLADDSRRELRIRCVVRPDKAQAMLLDRLGLRLPERLRTAPHLDEM